MGSPWGMRDEADRVPILGAGQSLLALVLWARLPGPSCSPVPLPWCPCPERERRDEGSSQAPTQGTPWGLTRLPTMAVGQTQAGSAQPHHLPQVGWSCGPGQAGGHRGRGAQDPSRVQRDLCVVTTAPGSGTAAPRAGDPQDTWPHHSLMLVAAGCVHGVPKSQGLSLRPSCPLRCPSAHAGSFFPLICSG